MPRIVPLSLSVYHLVVTSGLAFVFGLSFRLRLGLLFMPCYVMTKRVWTIRYDLYCPYFLPKVMVKFPRKARGHFVTLIKVGMHLIECISGQKIQRCWVKTG